MKLIRNTIGKLNSLLKGLSKNQRILLGVAIGYFLYVTYIKVENFFQEDEESEDVEDSEDVENVEDSESKLDVKEKVFQRSVWDNLAGNLGVKTSTLQLEDRQKRGKEDEFLKYQGNNKEVRQALAQADDFKKYD